MKRKLFLLLCALLTMIGVQAETDYTNLMSDDWTGSNGNFGGGKERYQNANYTASQKVMYQSFTAPADGIYEIKFYAVTSSTSGRGFDNKWGSNIAQAYASAGSNKAVVAMEVINQTGCTLVEPGNIRTLSVEAAEGETIEYGLENIAEGGNWYTILKYSAKMKTVAEIFQAQYDEAYAIWEHSTENELGARATFKTYVDALNTAMSGTLAEAQTASDNLAAALVVYESKSYPIKGSGVKYDFTSKMNMAIDAWTCAQGNGPAQYGFTGATETYKGSAYAIGDVMYQNITGLANGEYEIHFYAVANSPRGESEAGPNIAYVYANDQTTDIDVIAQDGCTPSDYERTITVMVKDGSIKYGLANKAAGGNWYVAKNVALYMTGAPDLSDYYEAIAENLVTANSYVGQKMGPQASAGLNEAISDAEGYQSITVIQLLEGINTNLINANAAASASISSYNALNSAIQAAPAKYTPLSANVEAYNNVISAAQNVYDNATVEDCTATINNLTTAAQEANVADYEYVDTNYPYAVNLGQWVKVNAIDRHGQHWDGTDQSSYSEQNEGWGTNSWECSYNQNITLPAGKYIFKVAGRKSSDFATLTLQVTNENEVIGLVSNFPNGDAGKGISTDGAANYGDGTYANDGNGRAWQWRFIEFTLNDPATVNVSVTGSGSATQQWVGFCNATVQTDDEENVDLMAALVALNDAKTAATLTRLTANVGTGVFQVSNTEESYLWGAYDDAKGQADGYEFTSSSTASEVNDIATALSTATTNYSNFLADPTLNAPDPSKRYWLSIVDAGQAWNGYAVTFIAGGRSDMGNYAIQYYAPASANMNQAVKFVAVPGKANTYKVSGVRAENGSEQYISTGAIYTGGNNTQIRTTDDVDKALEIKIQATSTDGQFKLLNTADGNKVIARNATNPDNGMYTDGDAPFTIAEASKATAKMLISAIAKMGTFCAPFDVTIPADVKAYTVTKEAENEYVTLTDVETYIPAGTPVLVEYTGTGNDPIEEEFTNFAAKNSAESEVFKGVFAKEEVAKDDNNYILQYQEGVCAFYLVDGDGIYVGANRCYLHVDDGSSLARIVIGGEDDPTAINAIEAADAEAEGGLKDGKYLIGNKIVLVKNGVKFGANGQKLN